jgi:hypothetical protein
MGVSHIALNCAMITPLSAGGMECPMITRSNCPFLQASRAAEKPTADSISNPSRESINSLVCNNALSYEMDSMRGIRGGADPDISRAALGRLFDPF